MSKYCLIKYKIILQNKKQDFSHDINNMDYRLTDILWVLMNFVKTQEISFIRMHQKDTVTDNNYHCK